MSVTASILSVHSNPSHVPILQLHTCWCVLAPPYHLCCYFIPTLIPDIPPDHIRQFPYPLPIDLVYQQDFGQPNKHDASELGIPSSMSDLSRSHRSVMSPPSITESHPPVGHICQYNILFSSTLNSPLHPVVNTSTNFFSGGYERLVVMICNVNYLLKFLPTYPSIEAGIIVTIQIQLLTSDSTAITTTTHTLLSFGIILELLGILLAICFIQ
jgi:hypothetical protein